MGSYITIPCKRRACFTLTLISVAILRPGVYGPLGAPVQPVQKVSLEPWITVEVMAFHSHINQCLQDFVILRSLNLSQNQANLIFPPILGLRRIP